MFVLGLHTFEYACTVCFFVLFRVYSALAVVVVVVVVVVAAEDDDDISTILNPIRLFPYKIVQC